MYRIPTFTASQVAKISLLKANARSKRRRPQSLGKRKRWTGVRLTELLGVASADKKRVVARRYLMGELAACMVEYGNRVQEVEIEASAGDNDAGNVGDDAALPAVLMRPEPSGKGLVLL